MTMNAKHGLADKTVAQIAGVLAGFPQVGKAVLFGSLAKGTQKTRFRSRCRVGPGKSGLANARPDRARSIFFPSHIASALSRLANEPIPKLRRRFAGSEFRFSRGTWLRYEAEAACRAHRFASRTR